MAILKIARMGHPVLLQKCDPVPDPGAPEIRRLVADMMETMEDAYGRPVAREVTGFHAGVVQHEYDHLDGILYPMRMHDFSLFGFNEELARAAATAQQE